MATLRGAAGQSYANSSSNSISLPSGTVAGDYCVAVLGNVWNSSSLTGITTWDYKVTIDTFGHTFLLAKKLLSADITAGQVTATFQGSGPGYSAIATASCTSSFAPGGYVSHGGGSGVASNTISAGKAKTGDIMIYMTTHRRDGVTPTATISQGTVVNESGNNGGSNWGFAGAIRTRDVASDGQDVTTFTYDAAGSGDMAVTWMFTDNPRDGALIAATAVSVGAAAAQTGFVYRGRATKTLDSGGVP